MVCLSCDYRGSEPFMKERTASKRAGPSAYIRTQPRFAWLYLTPGLGGLGRIEQPWG